MALQRLFKMLSTDVLQYETRSMADITCMNKLFTGEASEAILLVFARQTPTPRQADELTFGHLKSYDLAIFMPDEQQILPLTRKLPQGAQHKDLSGVWELGVSQGNC